MFDLRKISDDELVETLDRFYFLRLKDAKEMIYCVLKDAVYSKLIIQESKSKKVDIGTVVENTKMYSKVFIPNAESWYQGDLPLTDIQEVLIVRFANIPEKGWFTKLHESIETTK